MQYEYSPIQLAEVTDFSFLKDWDTIRIIPEGVSVMENCASCDQQGSDEHCIGHHDLAQETFYAKCQVGCQDEESKETVTIDADGEPVTIEYKDGLPHLVPINEEWWEE